MLIIGIVCRQNTGSVAYLRQLHLEERGSETRRDFRYTPVLHFVRLRYFVYGDQDGVAHCGLSW